MPSISFFIFFLKCQRNNNNMIKSHNKKYCILPSTLHNLMFRYPTSCNSCSCKSESMDGFATAAAINAAFSRFRTSSRAERAMLFPVFEVAAGAPAERCCCPPSEWAVGDPRFELSEVFSSPSMFAMMMLEAVEFWPCCGLWFWWFADRMPTADAKCTVVSNYKIISRSVSESVAHLLPPVRRDSCSFGIWNDRQ